MVKTMTCEICGKVFTSKIGEPYCTQCSKEYETQTDALELTRIIERRGKDWVKNYLEISEFKLKKCYNCDTTSAKTFMHKSKVYEGMDAHPDASEYIWVWLCKKCFEEYGE